MNKNTVIGSILVVAIMIWWFYTSSNNVAQAKATQKAASADSVAALQTASENGSLLLPKAAPELKAAPVLGGETKVAMADSQHQDSSANALDSAVAPKVIDPRTVVVETDKFIMTLTNKGAKIQSVVAKVLPDSAGNFPELIQDTALGALDLKLGSADLSEVLFDAVDAPEKIQVVSDTTVQFVFTDANGNQVVRSYGFTKEGAAVRQVNKMVGFSVNDYEISWNGGMRETEEIPTGKSFGGASYFFSEVVFNNSGVVEREMIREPSEFGATGRTSWAGLRRKYVAMTVQFDEPVAAGIHASPMKVLENDKDPGTYKLNIKDELRADSLAYNFMVLPLNWDEVAAYGKDYEKIIVSGWTWCGADVWFVWICSLLLKLLKFFYGIIPNYGVAIILVTFIVRGITTPFTVKQLKSTAGMAKLKPQLDEINVKYRSDPQKKQAAIMELYAKNGVNPLASCTGGCLPMIIQMPIFMGLFFVLGRAIELRGMPAFLWITDLSRSDVIFNGFSIPFLMPDGLALLPWIMVVTTYFQTKVTMQGGMDPAQQKMMTWMMPAMMFLFSAVMPSGLVLYWIISNFWSILQYKIIRRNKDDVKTVKGKKVVDAEIVK
ncbi:MAG: membrane protein insertase YidC [Fibrobacter sp.]|nr:membrane protein insertase YidC [Fibrobacter sp.]